LVWGFSGGGPYTLACAALLPDRFAAAAIVGSIAPWEAPGLDFFSGMGKDNVESIEKYLADPEAARAEGREEREELIHIEADELKEAWQSLLSPIDAAVVTDAFAQWMVRSFHEGLGPGEEGWWDDGVAHMAPWGFALDSIRIPVRVWHGHHDQFVPVQHGIWLAEHIPGAEAVIGERDGHLTLLATAIPSVHEWLLRHA
jgi:pimeloyl-ACP methyl ester carboxylesterase